MADNLDIFVRFLIDRAAAGDMSGAMLQLTTRIDEFQKRIEAAKRSAHELRTVARDLGQVSREAFLLGTVITGGIFAAAANYVKNAKIATETTLAWKAAQDSLGRSGTRAGAVLAREALPLLQKAAELADKAAGFVEKHPEIVRAALNTGLVLAGLGAVGIAVSKGIKIYADIAYLAAVAQEQIGNRIFAASVADFIKGVSEFAAAQGYGNLTASKPLTASNKLGPGPLTAIATGGLAYGSLGLAAANFGARQFGTTPVKFWEEMIAEEKQAIAIWTYDFGKLFSPEIANKLFRGISGFLGLNKTATAPALTGVQASPKFDEILKAYEKYKGDDLALVQSHYADRQKIIADSLKTEQDSTRRYSENVARVNAQESSALTQAARQFAEANVRAENEYITNRARTVRDGNNEILKIESDSKERLRKLAQEHGDRVDDLARSRDALGLAKEQRAYTQSRADETRNTNLEIQQRRRDLSLRLADLQQSYEQERAQRLADHQAQVAEIYSQAREELANLRSQHQAELNEIRTQRVAKIKELDQQFIDERKRRSQYFIQQIRDLDASLLGQEKLKLAYQQREIDDLNKFLSAYRAGLGSLGNITSSAGGAGKTTGGATGHVYSNNPYQYGKAGGGYAAYGTYLLGDAPGGGRGMPEYILAGDTTRAMEQALGGLSQEKMIALTALAGGKNAQITYNDSRRIDSRISGRDRNQLVSDTVKAVTEALQYAIS